jgi:hypothetical protein
VHYGEVLQPAVIRLVVLPAGRAFCVLCIYLAICAGFVVFVYGDYVCKILLCILKVAGIEAGIFCFCNPDIWRIGQRILNIAFVYILPSITADKGLIVEELAITFTLAVWREYEIYNITVLSVCGKLHFVKCDLLDGWKTKIIQGKDRVSSTRYETGTGKSLLKRFSVVL